LWGGCRRVSFPYPNILFMTWGCREILQHVMTCEEECPQLGMTLDKLFAKVSEYQKHAA
jgi:hypothetical protein